LTKKIHNMKKLFSLRSILILFLFVVPFVGVAQVATTGDYRSLASGNWNTAASWQVRDAGGNWTTASALPTSTNNVYIQNGHVITLDATVLPDDGTSLDLHIDILGTLAIAGANNAKVSGKIRCFTAAAAETSGADGLYTGTSSTATASTMITTTAAGVLKFVGGTRTITNSGEWNSSGTNNAAEFALDAGALGTLAVGVKFKNLVFSGGTITTTSFISAASGDLTIKNGARVISSRSTTANAVFANSSTVKCGIVTIEQGGILELTGSTPTIDCTTFANNGTVVYSRAGSQTLLQRSGGDATSTGNFGAYSTLVLANTSTKTPSSPITVSNLLQFTGTASIGATAAATTGLTLTMLNGSTVERSVTSGTSVPSTAGAVFYGITATDFVNVTIGSSITSSNEWQSAPTPGKVGTLTINPGVVYQHGGSRTVNNIVNNGQIAMTPNTTMTTTVTGTISGLGTFSTKLSVSGTPHFAASFAFTGPGPVGTLYMKQVADSNHLRNLTVNSPGGLILGNPVIVDTTLTLTNGTITNGNNLTLGTNIRINKAAGSLSVAPTFGSSIASLVYNDTIPTITGLEIPSSASVLKSMTINNAAGVTLNSSPTINETLTLSLGNLTIPATQTLRIASGQDIQGAPFSSTKYIITGVSGSSIGKLRVDNISTSKTLPIGTAAYFLPVTLTPSLAMNFEASVFTGVTNNGLLTGTPLTSPQKDKIVDAVWILDRITGTGNCDVQTSWDPALEGPSFSAFSNASIGMARHNGSGWDMFIGSGDNTTNTATASFANFSPFVVGELATVLPVTLRGINATIKAAGIEINWNVENEISIASYEIERSKNGYDFTGIGSVNASNRNSYSFTDATVLSGVFYYRIKIISADRSFKYSYIINVKQSNDTEINIYPNPVANTIFINGLKKNVTISLVNTAGQIVLKQNTTSNLVSLDVSRFKAGVYTIQIVGEDEKVSTKILIKK
jgi:hypothetical protein